MLDGRSGRLTLKHQRPKGGGEGERISWLPHGRNLQVCLSVFHNFFSELGRHRTEIRKQRRNTLTTGPASSFVSHIRVSHGKRLERWSAVVVAHWNNQSNTSIPVSQAASHLPFLRMKNKNSALVEPVNSSRTERKMKKIWKSTMTGDSKQNLKVHSTVLSFFLQVTMGTRLCGEFISLKCHIYIWTNSSLSRSNLFPATIV